MDLEEYNQRVKAYVLRNHFDEDFQAYAAWLSNAGMDVLSPWDIAQEIDVPRDAEHIPEVVEAMKDGFETPENRKGLNLEWMKERFL